MLIGGNSPAQGFTDRGRQAAEMFGPGVMLWLPSAGPQDAVRYPGCLHIVRLDNWCPDEVADLYVARIALALTRWRSAVPGVVAQLGNEPDIEAGHNGERIAEMAAAVKSAFPGVLVANPPLSVEKSMAVRADGCDVVSMHSYFERQHPESMADGMFGRSYLYGVQIAGDRPVIVTEFDVVQTNCPIDWPDRNRQAGRWLAQAQSDGVAGVCMFILDGQGEWASYDIGPEAALEMLASKSLAEAVTPAPAPPPPEEPPMTLTDAINSVTANSRTRGAMLMGAALETGTIVAPFPDQADGPAVGPFQIEAKPGGWHYGRISVEDARDPLKAARYMVGNYEAAVAGIGDADWISDPMHAYAQAAHDAERPAAMYPEERILRAWALVSPLIAPETPPATPATPATPAARRYEIVAPVDCPVLQGSDGTFSHGGASPGFYAIDYGCAIGTPIRAAAHGTVRMIYWLDSNPISLRTGHSVYIEHDNGYSTFSCHMTARTVEVGDRVVQGQIIGTTGDPASQPNNGYGDGPHLHWEIWQGSYFDAPQGARVKMEDLEAAGIAGPWSDNREDDMPRFGKKLDNGIAEHLWENANIGRAQAERIEMFDADHNLTGIAQAWRDDLMGGNGPFGQPWGVALSKEYSFPDGRTCQDFTNGVATATKDAQGVWTVAFN